MPPSNFPPTSAQRGLMAPSPIQGVLLFLLYFVPVAFAAYLTPALPMLPPPPLPRFLRGLRILPDPCFLKRSKRLEQPPGFPSSVPWPPHSHWAESGSPTSLAAAPGKARERSTTAAFVVVFPLELMEFTFLLSF